MKVKPASIIALQQEVSQLTVAVSGINFAVMCLVSMVLIRLAIPADPTEPGTWLANPGNQRSVYFALHLVPFMGLSFLWFMAVLRHRIGTDVGRHRVDGVSRERDVVCRDDVRGGRHLPRVDGTVIADGFHASRDTYTIGRSVTYTIVNVFAIRMGAAFIFATSALARRAELLPKWLTYLGYAIGNVLLFVIKEFAWIELLFPAWVLLVSLHLLICGPPAALTEKAPHR